MYIILHLFRFTYPEVDLPSTLPPKGVILGYLILFRVNSVPSLMSSGYLTILFIYTFTKAIAQIFLLIQVYRVLFQIVALSPIITFLVLTSMTLTVSRIQKVTNDATNYWDKGGLLEVCLDEHHIHQQMRCQIRQYHVELGRQGYAYVGSFLSLPYPILPSSHPPLVFCLLIQSLSSVSSLLLQRAPSVQSTSPYVSRTHITKKDPEGIMQPDYTIESNYSVGSCPLCKQETCGPAAVKSVQCLSRWSD